jgi:hypothetical protein
MGLVKKASKLIEGVRRQRSELRRPRQSKEEDLNVRSTGRIAKFVAAQKLRRRKSALEATAEDALLGSVEKEAMAQEVFSAHENDTQQIESFRKTRVMVVPQRIQIVEDKEEEDQSEEGYETESEDEVDESVVEDMRKLEESFRGISRKYRLINRIGEGILPSLLDYSIKQEV